MIVLYIDTNIFLNILLEEEGFCDTSEILINKILEDKYRGITSLLSFMEIHRIIQKQNKSEDEIKNAINMIRETDIEIIIPDSYDFINAYNYLQTLKIDPIDSIHIAIAIDNKAIFITRDEKLTAKIKRIIEVKTPEEVI